jgi:type II secretory pathway component PulM
MMEKLTAAYLRMNQRERMMTLAIAAILFLLINIFLWRMVLGSISDARRELVARKSTRAEQVVYMRERDLWKKRDEWLAKTQPEM